MTPFEHVTALFSFVYALALTHLLARVAELIVARDRVKFSGLLALGMANAVLLVFSNWLSIWDSFDQELGPLLHRSSVPLRHRHLCHLRARWTEGSGRRHHRPGGFFLAP